MGIVVATKGGLTRPEGPAGPGARGRPEQLRAACERSLRALQVECIDLYQLHAPDPRVPFADSVGALAELRRAGKIRWGRPVERRRRRDPSCPSDPPDRDGSKSVQPSRALALTQGVLAYCAHAGIGLLAYSPVGGRRYKAMLARRSACSAGSAGGTAYPSSGGARVAFGSRARRHSDSRRPDRGACVGFHQRGGLTLDAREIVDIDAGTFPVPSISGAVRSILSHVPGLRAAYHWVRGHLG